MKKNMKKFAVLSLSFLAVLGGQGGVVGQTYSGVRQVEKMALGWNISVVKICKGFRS